jgi:hypothetical protein
MFNDNVAAALAEHGGGAALYMTVAHDKGKPVARQGRKAVSLPGKMPAKSPFPGDSLVAEGDLKTSLDFIRKAYRAGFSF